MQNPINNLDKNLLFFRNQVFLSGNLKTLTLKNFILILRACQTGPMKVYPMTNESKAEQPSTQRHPGVTCHCYFCSF